MTPIVAPIGAAWWAFVQVLRLTTALLKWFVVALVAVASTLGRSAMLVALVVLVMLILGFSLALQDIVAAVFGR